jgi:molybdopterin synthase catalytic subunit
MDRRFSLSSRPLDVDALCSWMRPFDYGAFVVFEGRGRDLAGGREVRTLEYQAYEPLALLEGERILAAAEKVFDIRVARCVHRIGMVAAGEAALWVGVTGPLPEASFRACSHIVEEIRRRVPIWKRELFSDGGSTWAGGVRSAEPIIVKVRTRPDPGEAAREASGGRGRAAGIA